MAHIHYFFTDVGFLAESRKSACCLKAGAMISFTQNVLTLNTLCESLPHRSPGPFAQFTVACQRAGNLSANQVPLPSLLWHIREHQLLTRFCDEMLRPRQLGEEKFILAYGSRESESTALQQIATRQQKQQAANSPLES